MALLSAKREAILNAVLRGVSLDASELTVDGMEWSENGSTVSANYSVTDTIALAAADSSGNISECANTDSHVPGGTASAGCTLTHYRFKDGSTVVTNWIACDDSVVLVTGGYPAVAAGDVGVRLTAS